MGRKSKLFKYFIVLSLLLTLSACNLQEEIAEENPVPVEVAAVEKKNIRATITLGTQLRPQEELMIFAKTPGLKVTDLPVKLGDTVSAGALLFELDKDPLRMQVEQARLNYEMARAQYQRQKEQQASITTEVEEVSVFKSITRNLNPFTGTMEKEMAALTQDSTLAMAQAQVEQSRMIYANSLAQLAEMEYYAPIAGVISQINIQKNQLVMNQVPALTISDISRLKGDLVVTPQVYQAIGLGKEITVTADGQEAQGKISLVNPIPDQRTNLYLVEFTLDNEGHQLLGGVFAQARLTIEEKDNALVIPKEAIIIEGNEAYVFTAEDGSAHKKSIKTGIDSGEQVEILEGLKEGERVVIKGQHYLEEGAALMIGGLDHDNN